MLAVTKKRNVSDIVVLAVYCFFSANLVANNVFRANQIYAFESLIGPLPFVKYYMFGIPFEGMVGKKNYALILHKCHITDKNQEGGISYIHNKKTYVLCPQIYGRFNYHANIVTCYL